MTSELEAAERAVTMQPEDAGLWYRLGLARLDSGLLEQSEPCWRKVLALDPRHAKASVNLGLVLQHTGRGGEALQHYRNATHADPALAQAWFNLGTLLLDRGEPLDAIEPLRAAVKLDAGRPEWHAALGSALGRAGLPREAVQSLRTALQGDPSLHLAHSEMLQCAGELARAFDVEPPAAGPRRVASQRAPGGGGQPRVVLDGVFFQDFGTGISRVWQSLLQEWVASGFAERIVLLDREETAPRIAGVRRRVVPRHDYERLAEDRAMLQQVCDEERATVFASTYYTSPVGTPSMMTAYDMIPEVFGSNLGIPMWREKESCIRQARCFVAISRNTARDLCSFYPEVLPGQVTVAHCGISRLFRPAAPDEVERFKQRHGIGRPYFLLVGSRVTYKNAAAFLRVFPAFRERYAVVCVGGEKALEAELEALRPGSERHMLRLEDDDLRLAYAGAVALAYPSLYEGFGMPVAEAMASGCPVITTANASLPEVAGDAALYVKPMDGADLHDALVRIQDPALRESLVARGLERAKMFSWARMAKIIEGVLGGISA